MKILALAAPWSCAAQVALAWLKENIGAATLELTPENLARMAQG
jgi:hypothetical protein